MRWFIIIQLAFLTTAFAAQSNQCNLDLENNISWYCGGCAASSPNSYNWQWEDVGLYSGSFPLDDDVTNPIGTLVTENGVLCSGILISDQYFLTAAHCISVAQDAVEVEHETIDGTTRWTVETNVSAVRFNYKKESAGDNYSNISTVDYQVAHWEYYTGNEYIPFSQNSGVVEWYGWPYTGDIVDYAILRLQPNQIYSPWGSFYLYPGVFQGSADIDVASQYVGDDVAVVGYPGYPYTSFSWSYYTFRSYYTANGDTSGFAAYQNGYHAQPMKISEGTISEWGTPTDLQSLYPNVDFIGVSNMEIFPSNSGSPLLDENANVIGVLSWSNCFQDIGSSTTWFSDMHEICAVSDVISCN